MTTITFLIIGLFVGAVLLGLFAFLLEYCPPLGIIYGIALFAGLVWAYVNVQTVNLWLQQWS